MGGALGIPSIGPQAFPFLKTGVAQLKGYRPNKRYTPSQFFLGPLVATVLCRLDSRNWIGDLPG